MQASKPSVYSYSDFASLFQANVEWMKSVNSKFSWRWLGKRLQLKSHTHIINFANGSKSPSDEMLVKISDLFSWSIEEYLYAKYLLGLQTAKTEMERLFYQQKLAEIRRPEPIPVLSHDDFGLIAQWYHLVIFELMNLPEFRDDPEWIASKLRHGISRETASDALDRLLRLGLIGRSADGSLKRLVDGIFTTHNIPSGAITLFHKEMLERGISTLSSAPVAERLFLGFTMPFDSSRVSEAETLLIEFRNRFALMMEGGKLDSVYHLGLQFFPCTAQTTDKPS